MTWPESNDEEKKKKDSAIKDWQTKDLSINDIMEIQNMGGASKLKNVEIESELLKRVFKFLMPPLVIQSEEEKALWPNFQEIINKGVRELSRQSTSLTSILSTDEMKTSRIALNKYVKKAWKPNITMLDFDQIHYFSYWDIKIDNLCYDYEHIGNLLYEKLPNDIRPENPKCMFDWFAFYFYKTAKALRFLTKENPCITFEARIDDVNHLLSHMYIKSNLDGSIKEKYKFDRIFLSNIPDYTSLLYSFLECTPMLKFTASSFFKCKVLLNTGIWKDYEQYVYSGSLIRDLNQSRSLLNIEGAGDLWSDNIWTHPNENFKVNFNFFLLLK